MDCLPPEIQAEIIRHADVPIDTFLHYAKTVGAIPKKLRINQELHELLDDLQIDRIIRYNQKMHYNGISACAIIYKTLNRDKTINIAICEDQYTKQMVYSFVAIGPKYNTTHRINCDIHTGELLDGRL